MLSPYRLPDWNLLRYMLNNRSNSWLSNGYTLYPSASSNLRIATAFLSWILILLLWRYSRVSRSPSKSSLILCISIFNILHWVVIDCDFAFSFMRLCTNIIISWLLILKKKETWISFVSKMTDTSCMAQTCAILFNKAWPVCMLRCRSLLR